MAHFLLKRNFLSVEVHAELCYAECLLERAILTFIQVCAIHLITSRIHMHTRLLSFKKIPDHHLLYTDAQKKGIGSNSL